MTDRVVVVGAGVIGLTCAVRLAESGVDVDVLARDLPAETTSAVAGGLWLPFMAEPLEDVVRWARTSLAVFTALADDESTGVAVRPGHLLHRRPEPPPPWAPAVADVVPLTAATDPVPGYGFGWAATVPLVDTPRYLEHLRRRLLAAGGTLTRMPLPALPRRRIVVNCSGVAARALAVDPLVRAVRGQVVLLSDPGLTHWLVDEEGQGPQGSDLLYVLPRGRDVVVGGTAEDGDWSTTPVPDIAEAILRRAFDAVPALRTAQVLGHRAGLRPVRPQVRVAVEPRPTDEDAEHVVVHCYGHGGSGITLSWGCADDVVALVHGVFARAH